MVSVCGGLLLGSVDNVVLVLVDKPRRHQQRVIHLLSLLSSPLDWTEIETPQGPSLAIGMCVWLTCLQQTCSAISSPVSASYRLDREEKLELYY